MPKEKITIEDLATMIQKEFVDIRSDFDEKLNKQTSELKGEISELRNDVQNLTHRFNEHDKNQEKIIEKLNSDTFALKHVTKDHEKRITILEQKPA